MNNFSSVAVFLGPSLPKSQACQILNARYYPPAGKGDIYQILASGVEAIILIDGIFHNRPSVWHRELVNALEEGIPVFGAASMGALRAAELASLGAIGHGTVFEWYRDGVIDGDDEVAILHGAQESGFMPMSEPLVNIRYTLLQAVRDNWLAAESAQALINYAKQIYYPERSYQKLLESPLIRDLPEAESARLKHHLLDRKVDIKQQDAISVLKLYANKNSSQPPQPKTRFYAPSTDLQFQQIKMTGCVTAEGLITGQKICQVLEQNTELQARMRPILVKRCFLLTWVKQNSLSPPASGWELYREQWQQHHGIVDRRQWLQANGLTPLTYQELLADRYAIDWLCDRQPAYFGIEWNPTTALAVELSLAGGPTTAAIDRAEDRLTQIRHQLSQRRFLLEWASKNGVCCPQHYVDLYRDHWETAQQIVDLTNWLKTHHLTLESYQLGLVEQAMETWLLERGPEYFGIEWSFPVALFRELQLTGKVLAPIAHLSLECSSVI
jgi:hypothetical protein